MWLKDLVESLNNAKNPIDRFLLRGILIVILIGLVFTISFGGYSLFIGKHFKVASKDYGIDNPTPLDEVTNKSVVQTKSDSNLASLKNNNRVKPLIKHITVLTKFPIDTEKKIITTPIVQAKNYTGVNLGGHVGDNYYGNALDFTNDYGDYFINFIETFRRDSNITSKSLVINPFINCNSQKFGTDLMNYLKTKSYRVSIRYNVLTKEIFEGNRVSFDRKTNCFEVQMGNMFVDNK